MGRGRGDPSKLTLRGYSSLVFGNTSIFILLRKDNRIHLSVRAPTRDFPVIVVQFLTGGKWSVIDHV